MASLETGPSRATYALLWSLLKQRQTTILRLVCWAIILAAMTALYGAAAGPALKVVFGGEAPVWPAVLAEYLPPAPTLGQLRFWLPIVIVAAALVKGVAQARHVLGTATLREAVAHRLRCRAHEAILRTDSARVAKMGVGDLSVRLLEDVEVAVTLATEGLMRVTRDSLQVVILVGLCFCLDWRMATFIFAVYPLVFVPVARLSRRLRRASAAAQAGHGELATEIHEQGSRLSLIQMSGAQATSLRRVEERSRGRATSILKGVAAQSLASPITEFFGACALAGTLFYVVWLVGDGSVAPEHVMSFFASLMLLYQPVKGLVKVQEILQPGLAACARLEAVLVVPVELPSGGGLKPPDGAPEIAVRRVGLRWAQRQLLADITFTMKPGEITALWGGNGTGKTTIARLIGGMLRPSAGEVYINEAPLGEMDAKAWRQRVGWVTQSPMLGRGNIRENVCFGMEETTHEHLATVAQEVGLDAILARLPGGWQTSVLEGGYGLSGGEQQRIALARALLRRPTVLILDEPDAHLDDASIGRLAELLPSLAMGRTVLLVSHEPRLIAQADQIYALSPEGQLTDVVGL